MGQAAPFRDEDPLGSLQDNLRLRQLLAELAKGEPAARLLRSMAAKSRLEDLGQLSMTLAHELRQPLFTIAMATENLRLMLQSSDARTDRMLQSVARVSEQVGRAQAIIEQTLGYASGLKIRSDHGDLGEAADNAVRFLSPMLAEADIAVERRGMPGRSPVGVSPLELEQVFVNLLRNAMDSIAERRATGWEERGQIAIALKQCQLHVQCVIADNGMGLSKEASGAVFQPFFTTKARRGTGLGLHICRQIVTKGHGDLRFLPASGDGARIEISMPLLASSDNSGVVAS